MTLYFKIIVMSFRTQRQARNIARISRSYARYLIRGSRFFFAPPPPPPEIVNVIRRVYRVKNEELNVTQRERAYYYFPAVALSLSRVYPTKCFSILARTQLRAANANANANFISLPSAPPLVAALFAKESTLSRYFHRTACENVNFILLPLPYYTRYRYVPHFFLTAGSNAHSH